jgi:molecular chaperone GrpE
MPQEETTAEAEIAADMTDQTLADDDAPTLNDGAAAGGDPAARLAAAEARADAEHEAFLRARADFANYKRRTEEDREALKSYLTTDLLKRLLPIVDNFERALQAAETTKDFDKLIGGVNAVYRQLQELLTREGVTPIDALYQPFDPNLHNAVLREETTEHPENTVVEELQKGYTLEGRVLRPTMVKVAAGDA